MTSGFAACVCTLGQMLLAKEPYANITVEIWSNSVSAPVVKLETRASKCVEAKKHMLAMTARYNTTRYGE